MATTIDLVEGWTGNIDFTLLADGTAANLTGCSLELILRDRAGSQIDTSSDASIQVAASGTVRYTPDSTDLAAAGSPYSARWKVTDGSAKVTYFPSGEPDRWVVWKA